MSARSLHDRMPPPDGLSAGGPALRQYLGVTLYWFALSFFWGAMLALILPSRIETLFGPARKDATLAIVLSSGAIVAAVTQISFGALSDNIGFRWGRRRPYLLLGTVLASGALFSFPAARTLGEVLASYIAIQFLLNVAIGPYQALIPDQIPPEHHGRASALMGLWTLLGRMGGPVAATYLLARSGGLTLMMAVFAFILIAFMLATIAWVRESPAGPPRSGVRRTIAELFRVPLKPYPSFVWLLVSRFGIMMGFYTVLFCLLYYVEYALGAPSHDAALRVIANFMILSTLTGIAGTLPAGHLSDRMPKKSVLYVSNGLCILAGLGFLLARTLPLAYIAVALFGVGYGAFQAVDWALGCNLLPEHAPAKYLGVWGISDTAPQVIAPLIAGPVALLLNQPDAPARGYRVLMVIAMGYFALGTVALKGIKERHFPPTPL